MINSVQLIRNVGLFDSVNLGSTLPLSKLTVIYAENGRGKTTLAAILRSLGTGDPIPIAERRRLAAQHPPHIVIDCIGGPTSAMFQNNSWNRTLPNIVVFDDQFIDQNIYSGLSVDSEHRQNLHELILGSQGVVLNNSLQTLVAQIETHISELRTKAAAISVNERGNMPVDDFCALPIISNIDEEIISTERKLAAANEQELIKNTNFLTALSLPAFNVSEINAQLEKDLPSIDAVATEKIRIHFSKLGNSAETWVANGMELISETMDDKENPICPFCAQSMTDSPILNHYRAYFSQEYRDLQNSISDLLANVIRVHGGSEISFERTVRSIIDNRTFWSKFCDVPEIILDTDSIVQAWKNALNAITADINKKQATPLNKMSLSRDSLEFLAICENYCRVIIEVNQTILEANIKIQQVKESVAIADPANITATLNRLKTIKSRYKASTDALCRDYLSEKSAKAVTEGLRDQARTNLDHYRTVAFPNCQRSVNTYLDRFNAGFQLSNVVSANLRGGSTCTYNVLINNTPVSISGTTISIGQPSFRNTLSAGDRNTLALAFFLSSLDQDPALADKIVIIDDPISSMDEHRALTTIQEIRRLAQRVDQLIVLSHNKPFLYSLWAGQTPTQRAALFVTRSSGGSTICYWDVNQDCVTEHDRRHALLREYMRNNTGNVREVAVALRPSIEAFLRVACPEYFKPGTLLGPFKNLCQQRLGFPEEILDSTTTQELSELVEYANKFHHDTNPALDTITINDGELTGFVSRTLLFIRR